MEKFQKIPLDSPWLADIEAIYLHAFPKSEQLPFQALVAKAVSGQAEFAGLISNEQLVGFTYYTVYRDRVYIFYLAVSDQVQSQGYGQKLLTGMFQTFPQAKFMLIVEISDAQAANQKQRLRRKKFYLNNGFESSGAQVRALGLPFEMLRSKNSAITTQDYEEIQAYYYA